MADQERLIARLAPAIFRDLKSKLYASGKVIVTSQTTAHEAGFMLGIQHVLDVLEQGYVVEVATPVS